MHDSGIKKGSYWRAKPGAGPTKYKFLKVLYIIPLHLYSEIYFGSPEHESVLNWADWADDERFTADYEPMNRLEVLVLFGGVIDED